MEARDEDGDDAMAGQEDPLDIFGEVAAAAAPLPTNKRPVQEQAGRGECCFVIGCDCKAIKGIKPKFCGDAEHILQNEMNVDLGEWKGQPRKLPRDAAKN